MAPILTIINIKSVFFRFPVQITASHSGDDQERKCRRSSSIEQLMNSDDIGRSTTATRCGTFHCFNTYRCQHINSHQSAVQMFTRFVDASAFFE